MYSIKKKINFFDCDPAGILFYSRIFDFCHAAYESLISEIDPSNYYWNNSDFLVPIIKTEAYFHKPLKPGENVIINVHVSRMKDSSFELDFACMNEKNELCAEVTTVHVFIDKKKWEKRQIDGTIREKLKKYLNNQ